MPERKSDGRLGLDLTTEERKLLLDDDMFLDESLVQAIRQTPPGVPVHLTLDELVQLADELTAESRHIEDGQLDPVCEKIQLLLDRHADGE